MMETKGMTAIVRGLPDSRLIVTLVDGGRQYTLMPQEAEIKQTPRPQNICSNMSTQHSQCVRYDTVSARCDIGSQAVDSRYASSYKMDYCQLRPTSPSVEVTEFPPQHHQVYPGRGNFEVGGLGSGSHSPIRSKNTYIFSERPNKGRSITPRDSMKPDAFTESLRKYPIVSPDSSEVVQRLHSYSKEFNSSRSNLFKLNECVNCYHAAIDNRSAHNSRKDHANPKTFQRESLLKNLTSHTHSISSKLNEHNAVVGKNKPGHGVRSNNTYLQNTRPVNSVMKDSEFVNDDENFNKSSDNITTSLIMEKEILFNTYQETISKESSIRNTSSTKASKSLIELGETTEKKPLQKRKKIGSHLQLHKKCKKIKHKPRFAIDINKKELRNFKTDVNLTKNFNDSDSNIKLEENIKMLVCNLLEGFINPEKKLKEELLKNSSKNDIHITRVENDNRTEYECTNIFTTEKALDEVHKRFIILLKNHLKRVSEIHTIIIKEMLRIVRCILEKKENKELEFSISKICKYILNTFGTNENKIFGLLSNSLELRKRRREKGFQRYGKNIFNINARSRTSKYNSYLTSLRKLIKSETLHAINNYEKTHKKTKKPCSRYLKIIHINRILNTVKSFEPFQTQYVTNMLLNQYCKTKHEESVCHQRTNNNTVRVAVKCLSDTYILIHSTSQNKSILTQSKIDKINLQNGTKLLTSIKNKYAYEANKAQTENNYTIFDNLNKCYPTKHVFSRVNDILLPIIKKQHAISDEENFINQNIYREVEKKVYMWFSKYCTNLFPLNNKCREKIAKCITKEVTDQLILYDTMKSNCPTKSAYAEKYLKNIITRHLYRANIKVEKISELVQDILNIRHAYISKNNRVNLPNQLSQTTLNSVENNAYKPAASMISVSKSFEGIKNVLEDIYAKVEFCNDNVRKSLVKNYMEEVEKNYSNNNDNDIEDFYKEQKKYSHFSKNFNKSGVINVAMANENTSSHSCHSNRSNVMRNNDKTNQTENFSAHLADTEAQVSSSNSNIPKDTSVGFAIQKLHEYCVDVFRKHCERLPILAITPELEELARAGVLHNIMNTFSTLLKDPDIANDYTLFELHMEDDTDELLDLLPQTEEIKRVRETWKINLLMDSIMLLKHIHKITDAPGIEDKLNEKTSRRKLLKEYKRENDEAQQLNVLETVEEYMKSTDYHDPNPLVVRIYTQRLVDRTNELYNCFKKSAKTTFLKLPVHELRDVIFRELNDVSKPNNNITREEIDLVNMNDEVANWYKQLPVLQMDGIIDNNKRKILIQTLAKKIHNMEKNLDLDEPSVERNMKHEISMFLSNKATGLQYEQDLNINSMVDKLTDRLRKKRHEKLLNYDSFVQNLPLSSTIAQHDIPYDDTHYFPRHDGHMVNNEQFDINNRLKNLHDSSLVCSLDETNIKLKPIAKNVAKGILGVSQIAGPSTRDNSGPSSLHLRLPTPREEPQTISGFSPRSCSPDRCKHNSGPCYDLNHAQQTSPKNTIYIKEEMLSPNNRSINDQMTPSNYQYMYGQRTSINDRYMNEQITPNYNRFMHDQTPTSNRHMNFDGRTSTPYQRHKRSANPFSIFWKKRHTDNLNNFSPYDLRLPYPGQAFGTSSTRQMGTLPDRMKTLNLDSERSRNPSKIRCLCADRQLQPCRRYSYCYPDNFPEDCCCRYPCQYFY